jgi:hypothetical protein
VPRLRIELRPSLWIAATLGAAHVLAVAAAWLSLERTPLYVVLCGIALSAMGCLSEVLHRNSRSALALELLDDGRARWQDRRATWHEGRLGDNHFVSEALVVMRVDQTRGGRRWLVLSADSGAREDMRRLRAWLRWHRETAAGKGGVHGSRE